MHTKLTNHYHEAKAEYDAVQKTLADLKVKQAHLETKIVRLNLSLQVEGRGITHKTPTGFITGRMSLIK